MNIFRYFRRAKNSKISILKRRKRKANILHDVWKIQNFQFSITFSLYNYRCPEKKILGYENSKISIFDNLFV